jgi:streptogramin lyase
MGGQQPVTGATIQLYTVGTTGTAAASAPLLTSSVTTDANGMFSITGKYSCSSATQVYITATGGSAGAGTNADISLMAALGACSSLTSSLFININELSTIAADYALAPFMADYAHIGATGSNPTGLVNAFKMATTLVNYQAGAVATAASGVSLPITRLNTLANILSSCINGTAAASTAACTTLLSTTGAAETIGAGLGMAKSAGNSTITSLYTLVTGTPPFSPGLSAQPNDFTLPINYTGSELASPGGIAFDASGNAWVTNEAGFSVVKMPPLSTTFVTATYTNGGLVAPRGISIDRSGNAWIANTGANNVVELSPVGAALSSEGYVGGGISTPVAIANDSAGNAWVVNFGGSSITELSSTGVPTTASPITSSLSYPTGIGVDSSGNIAVANGGTGQMCVFTNAGVLSSCVNDSYLLGSTALAVSTTGNVAMTGTTTGTSLTGAMTLGTSAGVVNTASPVTGGGLAMPMAVAFDGNGTAWVANSGSISAVSSSGTVLSPAAGYGSVNSPAGIAVDPSGNVWTANSGDNSVTVFVGLGAATKTPIALSAGP